MMGQTIYADGRPHRLQMVKDMVAKHFLGGNVPKGLLIDLYQMIGQAELKGFDDCLDVFRQQASPANDDRSIG
jgi:hypothetical protein